MKNLICVSTGAVYKISEDMNKKIELLKEFSPDGIELCFADSQYLIDFKITKENLTYLCTLKYVSIHAPWLGVRYGNNERTLAVLKSINNLYCEIDARNVVFHADFIDNFSVFENYDFTISIENNEWKYPFHLISEIELLLKNNKKFKFTFDFAHALTVSVEDIPVYVEKFKEKLIQVHFAYFDKELPDHWFSHKYDSEEIRKLSKYLKVLDVPIVLECVANDESEVSLIGKELKYVRNIFTGFPPTRE